MDAAHPFAHLGPAPYRFLGCAHVEEIEMKLREREEAAGIQTHSVFAPGACRTQTCDHCSNSIEIVYRFRAADGRTFKVGCDCAEKALDPASAEGRAFHKARKARAREARHAREALKVEAARALLDAHAETLRALPHPFPGRAAAGETLLDSLLYRWDLSGTAGRLKIGKEIRALLGAGPASKRPA